MPVYGRPNPVYATGLSQVAWNQALPRYSPARIIETAAQHAGLSELGLLPAVPVAVYGLAAATAAGALIGAWLSAPEDEWNSPEYFDQAMSWLHATLLAWDKESWVDDRCKWRGIHATQRQQWVAFMKDFGAFYNEVGSTKAGYTAWVGAGVRDRFIPAAKSFMRQLKDVWVPFFEQQCGFAPTGAKGVPAPEKPPMTPTERIVMWGALAVGAVALASVVRTLKQ